ncbi:MAG TPA: phage holin family protein [Verrucomicrobiae bacterium]|nr:phage holin family protein [Verrucomicrobiae bacterium]
MEPSLETEVGLMASLRRLLDSALALVQNRLQLLGIELEEERVRLFDLVLRVVGVAVFSFLALIAATALVVVWLWETSPVAVLIVITLLYAGLAVWIGYSLKQRLHHGPPPFAGTLAEFKKDCECLGKSD